MTRRRKRRRTSHGVVCGCGSVVVSIDNTATRELSCHVPGERLLVRKQRCKCHVCGEVWWRRLRVQETVLD